MKKCPCCGYEFDKKYNPSIEIIKLLSKRDKITKAFINSICSHIERQVSSEKGITNRFKFIKGISHVDNTTIQNIIIKFNTKKMFMRGYGYNYLRGMIIKEHNDAPQKKLNELKRYGKPPSKKKENKDAE
jgi:hypothetical protein|tara:strand:- start:58 stop:447 length:390 start_codon:yes stop_codon:yes gene_type:complete